MLDKLYAFLSEYIDLYGNDIFIDTGRLDTIKNELRVPASTETAKIPSKNKDKMTKTGNVQKSDIPLWKFREEIKDCVKCALGYSRNKFVFGDGNPDADIMFIGEAPGSEEDRTGIPFVGRAGQLLNKLLSGIQIDRDEVFIANILKCRPPNNRDPQPNEVQECIPYLHKQIKMIQPKVIVALGRIAAQNLLETSSSLKQMRERLWQYQNVTMIVTYHPAAILRNPGLLETARQDFQFILKTYKDVKKHQI